MKTLTVALAALSILFTLAACSDEGEEDSSPAASATAATSTSTPTPAIPTDFPTPVFVDVCTANPDPATPDMNVVTTPTAGDVLSSPVQVTGRIAAFEATFRITIYDAQSNVLADQAAMSSEGQTLAPFSVTVPFTVTAYTPACIWVYEISAADGVTPIHIVQIPVALVGPTE